MRKAAFTLIELLTVMAITAVMLTLIVLPIFQSFNVLRTAQAFADAQDKARGLTDRIAREVGNAISVRDAAATVAILPTGKKDANGRFIPNSTFAATLPYTKLDLIPPAQNGDRGSDTNPGFIDPVTGKVDPTLTRPKGDINIVGVPGATLVRYWVGPNRPLDASGNVVPYNEPYTGLLMDRNGNRDNLLVLRRIEVQPFIYRPRKDGQNGTDAWRPNLAYFRSDDKNPNAPANQDFDTRIIDLDDPYFFVPDGQYQPEGTTRPQDRQPDPDKNLRVMRWAAILNAQGVVPASPYGRLARNSAIVTEVSRYDMIRPVLTGTPPRLVTDANGNPNLIPLVQFRPTRVAAEPAAGNAAARPGEAVDGIDRIGPDTYQTSRGLWTNAIVRYYPGGYAPGVDPTTSSLEIANVDTLGGVAINRGVSDGSGLDLPATGADDTLFNLKLYEQYLGRGQNYPFSAAALNQPAWLQNPARRALFTPFRVVTNTGKIITSFSIDEVGNPNVTPPSSGNLPYAQTLTALTPPQVTPTTDPSFTTAPLSMFGLNDRTDYNINRAFNRVFLTYPELQSQVQRFLDLRFVPNADGTPSPLNPNFIGGQITGFAVPVNGSTINRAHIVPGSESVFAPNQSPGADYGKIIRYTRVTGEPGPNQYRLVYADLPEPINTTTGRVDYSGLGLPAAAVSSGRGAFDPAVYDETNVVSAQIQPRFKAGYLQFDSDPNVVMPPGQITVTYRFQFNGPRDTFAVDLDTREVMQILLTIKNYPQSNVPNAQTITLKSTATLRNALR